MSPSAIVERAIATPQRWPVRWRLAAVSAMLTLIILVGFAAVVGRLTANKLENDFRDDLRNTASEIALKIDLARASGALNVQGLRPLMSDDDHFRVVDSTGRELEQVAPRGPDLGPPDPAEIRSVGPYEVAAAEITTGEVGFPLFVQYAQNHDDVQTTIDRLWLFLAAGVFVGTVLAYLAGLAVAVRAMRPISSLTAAAREIASTGDPSGKMPTLTSDDEVAELGHTLEDMLRSLDEARSETEQAMQRQREFVADASHELRTPLTSVLANLELLELELEGEQQEAAASALRSSRRMRRLVADLLLLARADAGRVAPREPVDLSAIVAEAAGELEPVAGDHQISVDAPPGAELDGARDELHRLTLNLLENALRHTDPGTAVEATVERDNGVVILSVEDDGPGIPPELRDKVFERFFRGAGDRSGSSGLGLSIVRAVARSHDGTVTLEEPLDGRGARFVVRFPARR